MTGQKDILSDLDKCDSIEEFKDHITDLTRELLCEHFKDNVSKQKLKIYRDRITFACPYCDDSMRDSKKKRGNLIFTGKFANAYKCFNCGTYTSIVNFFKRYNKNVPLSSANYISTIPFKATHDKGAKIDISLMYDTSDVESMSISVDDIKRFYNLVPIEGTYGESYVRGRYISDMSHFLYSPMDYSVIILNKTTDGNVIGFQKRLLNPNAKNKYLTFKLSKIYNDMGLDSDMVTDEMDMMSGLFFIFFVDWSKTVTVFEGPFDSMLFPNSIGQAGVHKNLPFDGDIRYFSDFDDAGLKDALEKMRDGYKAFLWRKCMDEYNIPYNTFGKNKKWDLTDLVRYFVEHNMSIYPRDLEKFFSDSILMGMLDL